MKVVEHERVVRYLHERGLMEQYKKAKNLIREGLFHSVQLKKRQPKTGGIWYFRITRKFRALCLRTGGTLIVFEIDDHQ